MGNYFLSLIDETSWWIVETISFSFHPEEGREKLKSTVFDCRMHINSDLLLFLTSGINLLLHANGVVLPPMNSTNVVNRESGTI